MKPSQKASFEENYKQLATLANAISHPARITILKLLMDNNGQTCKSIVSQLPFSQSTVSQHLAELKQAGLITGQSHKTSMIYSLELETLNKLNKLVVDVFQLQKDKKQLSLF